MQLLCSEERADRFGIGILQLNNPGALNAITFDMFRCMKDKLEEWRLRDDIACVVLHSESDRAFSAGGDVKSLAFELTQGNPGFVREFFTHEYFVDYLIHVYPKPVLCWADGITMGGGIGIMNGACQRIVTERTVMAMPEVSIGFFPDVGATYFLRRLPGSLGLFLGLTAARFDGASALAVGMADAWIHSTRKQRVFEELIRLPWSGEAPWDKKVLEKYVSEKNELERPAGCDLLQRLDLIEKLLEPDTIEEVDESFRQFRTEDVWLRRCIDAYSAGSPTSAAVTFQVMRHGPLLSLKDSFLREWNMAVTFCEEPDFREGVRALLIDKDGNPRWFPPTLSLIGPRGLEKYLSPEAKRPHPLLQMMDRAVP